MLFGIVTLVGGIVGFVQKDSVISLIAGGLLGLLLIVAGLTMQKGKKSGIYMSLIATLAILGQFGRTYFFGDGTFMWSGLMSILGILSLLLLIVLMVQPAERKRIF